MDTNNPSDKVVTTDEVLDALAENEALLEEEEKIAVELIEAIKIILRQHDITASEIEILQERLKNIHKRFIFNAAAIAKVNDELYNELKIIKTREDIQEQH